MTHKAVMRSKMSTLRDRAWKPATLRSTISARDAAPNRDSASSTVPPSHELARKNRTLRIRGMARRPASHNRNRMGGTYAANAAVPPEINERQPLRQEAVAWERHVRSTPLVSEKKVSDRDSKVAR